MHERENGANRPASHATDRNEDLREVCRVKRTLRGEINSTAPSQSHSTGRIESRHSKKARYYSNIYQVILCYIDSRYMTGLQRAHRQIQRIRSLKRRHEICIYSYSDPLLYIHPNRQRYHNIELHAFTAQQKWTKRTSHIIRPFLQLSFFDPVTAAKSTEEMK